jgi:hypothetical protein
MRIISDRPYYVIRTNDSEHTCNLSRAEEDVRNGRVDLRGSLTDTSPHRALTRTLPQRSEFSTTSPAVLFGDEGATLSQEPGRRVTSLLDFRHFSVTAHTNEQCSGEMTSRHTYR